jgi:hypothetical protein
MSDEKIPLEQKLYNRKVVRNQGDGIVVYGLGLIGAALFFIQHSTTFLAVVLGILKAVIWPVIIVYKLLEFLKM